MHDAQKKPRHQWDKGSQGKPCLSETYDKQSVPSMRYKYIIVLFSVNVNGFEIFSDNFEKSA